MTSGCAFSSAFSSGFDICLAGDPAPSSGIFAAGTVLRSPRIDPLLALKPDGGAIRELRRLDRLARKRVRGG